MVFLKAINRIYQDKSKRLIKQGIYFYQERRSMLSWAERCPMNYPMHFITVNLSKLCPDRSVTRFPKLSFENESD